MNIRDLDVNNLQQVEQYINQKMTKKDGNVKEIAPMLTPVVDEFISSDIECYANLAFANPLVLDDQQMYIEYLKDILSKNSSIENAQKHLPNTLISTFNFVTNYFGGQVKGLREQINESQEGKHSITQYKDKNAAVCFERSVVTHNLLKLIEIDSTLVLNKSHAYNMINCGNDKHILLDVTNWVNFKGDEIEFILPILQIVEKTDYDDFYYGKKELVFNKDAITRLANLLYPNKNLQIVNDFDFTYPALNQSKEDVLGL